jgi:hypothetical protein
VTGQLGALWSGEQDEGDSWEGLTVLLPGDLADLVDKGLQMAAGKPVRD